MTTEDKLQEALKEVEQQKSVTRQAVEDERNRLLDEIAYGKKIELINIEGALAKARASVFENPREVRAFALKTALDSRQWWDRPKTDEVEATTEILTVAKKFEAYVLGDTK